MVTSEVLVKNYLDMFSVQCSSVRQCSAAFLRLQPFDSIAGLNKGQAQGC